MAEPPTAGASTMSKARLRRLTLLAWVWTFASFMVWSVATPLWTSPDAPAHDLMAYHAVRDLSIERTSVYANGGTSNAITRAPKGLVDSANSYTCYAHLPTPASCIQPIGPQTELVDFVNPAGRNMPTYYVATGWPSLFAPTKLAVYAERVAAAALAALFVAWAFGALMTRRRPSMAVTGLAMAMPPMVMYMGGAVNPNSTEITCGMAVAACSLVFLLEGPDTWLGRAMYRRTMIAIAVMVTMRMLAPVWVLVWAAAFAILATRRHWAHVFSRRGLPWTGLAALGVAFDAVWTLTSGITEYQAEPKFANSLWDNVEASKAQIDNLTVSQQIGNFGWLDTLLPNDAYLLVLGVVVFLASTAFLRLTTRQAVAVGTLAVLQYVVPVLLQAYQWNTNGPVWQGRYTLPMTVMLAVFVMVLAAEPRADETEHGFHRQVAWTYPLAVLALATVHHRAMLAQLKRNISGLDVVPFAGGEWHPPVAPSLIVLAELGLLAVAVVFLLRLFAADYARLDRPVLGLPNPWRSGWDTVVRRGRPSREEQVA